MSKDNCSRVEYRSLDFFGYSNYRVGNDGSVQSRKYDGWKTLKPQKLSKYGYLIVSLCKQGKPKCFLIHHLVLFAFVGPKPDGMETRHFPDKDPSNNRLENLSWGTPKQNYQDQVKHGT